MQRHGRIGAQISFGKKKMAEGSCVACPRKAGVGTCVRWKWGKRDGKKPRIKKVPKDKAKASALKQKPLGKKERANCAPRGPCLRKVKAGAGRRAR